MSMLASKISYGKKSLHEINNHHLPQALWKLWKLLQECTVPQVQVFEAHQVAHALAKLLQG
jgi:hypothetical protein